jgi:hypothetical protein
MIVFTHKGDFKNTEKFLTGAKKINYKKILDTYGKQGVQALAFATPIGSGLTADSWDYKLLFLKGSFSIVWTNSNVVNGVPIAIILQYGHGTRNGGYVQGRDYINPALQSMFDRIADAAWREVTRL